MGLLITKQKLIWNDIKEEKEKEKEKKQGKRKKKMLSKNCWLLLGLFTIKKNFHFLFK
jgi:hypothetical protein